MKRILHGSIEAAAYYRKPSPGPHDPEVVLEMGLLQAALAELGLAHLYNDSKFHYDFKMDMEDQRLHNMIAMLQERPGIMGYFRVDRVFTEEERSSAPLLCWRVTNQAIESDSRGFAPDAELRPYITCTHCRTHLAQRRNLILRPSRMKSKDISLTHSYEFILSERTRRILEENKTTGFGVRPVEGGRQTDAPKEIIWQLESTHVLPPMSPPTAFDPVRTCEVCQTTSVFVKHNHVEGPMRYREDTDIYYASDSIDDAQDINFSHELFGELPIAHRLFIISQRFYQILRAARVKNWIAEPVYLV